jgi:hypothetical protein
MSMTREISKSERRLLVSVNYLSILVIVLIAHAGGEYGWSSRLRIIAMLASAGVLLATFIAVFWRTRLWQTTHASFDRLDERQVQVMYDSLRSSYSIFVILCLVILYLNSVAGEGSIPILVAGAMLYLGHTLPAAVVAWTEKEVLIGE